MERCRRGGVPTSAKTAIGQPKTIPLAVLPRSEERQRELGSSFHEPIGETSD